MCGICATGNLCYLENQLIFPSSNVLVSTGLCQAKDEEIVFLLEFFLHNDILSNIAVRELHLF